MTMSDGSNRHKSIPITHTLEEAHSVSDGFSLNQIGMSYTAMDYNGAGIAPLAQAEVDEDVDYASVSMAHCVEPPLEYQSKSSVRYDNYARQKVQSPGRSSAGSSDIYNDITPESSLVPSDDEQSESNLSICMSNVVSYQDNQRQLQSHVMLENNNESKPMDITDDPSNIAGAGETKPHLNRRVNSESCILNADMINMLKERQVGGNSHGDVKSLWEQINGVDGNADKKQRSHSQDDDMVVDTELVQIMKGNKPYFVEKEGPHHHDKVEQNLESKSEKTNCQNVELNCKVQQTNSQPQIPPKLNLPEVTVTNTTGNSRSDSNDGKLFRVNSSASLSHKDNARNERSCKQNEPSTSRQTSEIEIKKVTVNKDNKSGFKNEYPNVRELREYRERNTQSQMKRHEETSNAYSKLDRIYEVLASFSSDNPAQDPHTSLYKFPVLPATTISCVNPDENPSYKSYQKMVGPSTTLSYVFPEDPSGSKLNQNTRGSSSNISYSGNFTPRTSRSGSLKGSNFEPKLQAHLNKSGGFFQIGPRNGYDEEFCFAVTIIFAKDLSQVC